MCCSGFLKIMMFIFNGCIFLAGAAILGVGVWVKVDGDSLMGLLDDGPSGLSQLVNVSYGLIVVGAVLLVIGFLGCCGAVTENKCMLLTFFSIVLIIFIIEVAGAVVLFVFQGLADELFDSLREDAKKTIGNKYGKDEGLTSLWNATMERRIDGCFSKLLQLIEDNAVVVAAVVLAIAALEIAAMVVSMVLYNSIGKK